MSVRLIQHLLARNLIAEGKANEALRRLAITGGSLDTVLLEQGTLGEKELLASLSEIASLRPVNLAEYEPNHEVAPLIPPKIAERLCVVPLSVDESTLHVACGYPPPKGELDEVGFLLGKQLVLWIGLEVRIRDWISAIYRVPLAGRYAILLAQLDPSRPVPTPVAIPVPPPPPLDALVPTGETDAQQPKPAANSTTTIQLIEERTLEDALNSEMLERIAQAVLDEPIPLEVKKDRAPSERKKPAASPKPEPPPKKAEKTEPVARNPEAAPKPDHSRSITQPHMPVFKMPEPHAAAEKPATAKAETKRAEPARAKAKPTPAAPRTRAPAPVPTPPPPPPPAPAPTPAPVQMSEAAAPIIPTVVVSPPMDSERDVVPDWTLAQARVALKHATSERDQLIDVALRFGRRTFDYAAAFAVIRGAAAGWDVRGPGTDRVQIAQISIPLDSPSVFRTVALTRGSYVGPLPPDSLSKHFLDLLGRAPRTVFLYPVEVKARLVAILYGDCGQRPISQLRLSEFILLCQDLPSAFQELILHRKARGLGMSAGATAFAHAEELNGEATPPPALSLGWSPFSSSALGGLGRAASTHQPVMADGVRPPSDFTPLLRRLTGPDAAQRARAMAELARTPEASAQALVLQFPGPTAWSRLPVVELPEADELGPIPGALSRLGRPGAQALAQLLDSDDSDTRYLALLTAGNLAFPELVDGVLRGLFDLEPDISSAARAASTAFKKVSRFDGSMKGLRQEVTSRDPLRRALAARALGVLHDREAIDGLIGLTGSDDQMTGQAAAEALREITRASFGTNPRQWTMWWAENRLRRRSEWLVVALRHTELDIRQSALEELSRALNEAFGYEADGHPDERERAVQRWEQFLQQKGRGQKFDV